MIFVLHQELGSRAELFRLDVSGSCDVLRRSSAKAPLQEGSGIA